MHFGNWSQNEQLTLKWEQYIYDVIQQIASNGIVIAGQITLEVIESGQQERMCLQDSEGNRELSVSYIYIFQNVGTSTGIYISGLIQKLAADGLTWKSF